MQPDRLSSVSIQTPLPVSPLMGHRVIEVSSAETIQFIVSATNSNDVGSAAGIVVYGRITNKPILDSRRSVVGYANNTSFSWVTGTCFTTLKEIDWVNLQLETNRGASRNDIITKIVENFANGEYCIDHENGIFYGKKATTATSDTATYAYRLLSMTGVTVDTEFPTAAALADNTANPTTTSVAAHGMVFDGVTWDRTPGNSSDGTLVNLGTNNDVTVTGSVTANAGTNLNTSLLALEAGGNLAGAATSLAVMDDWDNTASDGASVSGDVAHDGVDAGEPVKIGGKAFDPGTPQTAVVANDRVNAMFDLNGRIINYQGTTLDSTNDSISQIPSIHSNINTSALASSLIVKASAGRLYRVKVHNNLAGTQFIQIHDAASVPANGAVPEIIYLAPASTSFEIPIPEGMSFTTGIVITNSSTAATKTLGAADCWFQAIFD